MKDQLEEKTNTKTAPKAPSYRGVNPNRKLKLFLPKTPPQFKLTSYVHKIDT